ncbi:unnamed protein product [Parascedosporium putredinis]|uniref:Uncharacterized protein n=1 Tax=Parascedosporium putredinis TaxID=1442378 RepID=A0A9P1GZU0_9PEZI|nr:unnamed protein product [Parascedosporium putredinis]CAI7991404.1 unnamed protein product [Parascedosporium putredinis]
MYDWGFATFVGLVVRDFTEWQIHDVDECSISNMHRSTDAMGADRSRDRRSVTVKTLKLAQAEDRARRTFR